MSLGSLPIVLWLVLIYATLASTYAWILSRKQKAKEWELLELQNKLSVKQRFLNKKQKELNILEYRSNLKICDIYIERCEHYIEVPPENFNGVFVHTTKG